MKNAIIYTVLFAALQVVVSIVTQLVWNRLLGNSGVMGTEFMIGTSNPSGHTSIALNTCILSALPYST